MQPQQPQPNANNAPQGVPNGAVSGGAAQPQMKTAGTPERPRNPNTTQNTLLISEMRDQMVIMNDGSFRAVIACQSINFDLMSEREREGVEYSYQSFLNSLYFPVQIFIRSQRVDIGPYIERLSKIRREQDNMLLGVLMDDYINFIAALSQETNIMDKDFYIVVPYYPTGDVNAIVANSRNFFSALLKPEKQQHIQIDQTAYAKAKEEISNRVNAVLSGLFQMGVRGSQLNTKQLAELYYNVYNPDTAVREPLGNFENLTSTFVQKGTGQAPQSHLEEGA
jgi:type IV secretory pathway VirB4 component